MGNALRLRGILGALALLCVLLGPVHAHAQAGPFQLDVSPVSLIFPVPSAADYDRGYVEASRTVVVEALKERFEWVATVASTGVTIGANKPLSDLEFQVQGTAGWTPMRTVPQVIATGLESKIVVVRYRLRLSWQRDPPGTYTAALSYVLTRQ
jgi:hypothetical protein